MGAKRLAVAAMLVLIAGCSHQALWTKPGATQKDFDADRSDCLRQSGSGSSSQDAYNSCMMGRGYSQTVPATTTRTNTAAADRNTSAAGPVQFAELFPVGMLQAALASPPPGSVMGEPAQPMPIAPTGPVYGGHLASYFRDADALRGWNIIVGQQSSIGSLKRHIVPIQTAKGPMVRLIAGDFTSMDEATRFCTWARQQRLYCMVMALSPNDQASTPVPTTTASPRSPRRARKPS